MDRPSQVLGHFQIGLDERAVDDQLRLNVGELGVPPSVHLLAHAVEIPLHLVDADGECVLQREVFGVLGQDRLEIAREGHGFADEYAVLCGANIYVAPCDRRGSVRQLLRCSSGGSSIPEEPGSAEHGKSCLILHMDTH